MRKKNRLYYGDNLDVLRRHIAPESVDLVYLDPPFNSDQDYNVLFRERATVKDAAQIKAFEDTWGWNQEAEDAYYEAVKSGGAASKALVAMRGFLGQSDMMAYLAMMVPRLDELRHVLKPTGGLYLHCDPTASHYLKVVLDAIFGVRNFRNEIVWRRTRAHNDRKIRRYGAVHDTLLFYSKSDQWTFNPQFTARDENAPRTHDLYVHTDGKTYRKDNCRAPGDRGPRYEWNGHVHHWRFSPKERDRLIRDGRIVYSKSGMPRVLRPIDPNKGSPLQDVWTDIDPPNSGSRESTGYPTQKPVALLDRLVRSSTNEGDMVLDPFCGCGTAIEAAQELGRRWIGIDVTHIAISVIKRRLLNGFDAHAGIDYEVIGEPTSLAGAHQLASEDRHQFEHWALGLVGARASAKRKGADQGIDGRFFFHDDHGEAKQVIVSVKSGKTSAKDVRDLRGVIEREKATIGALITLQEGTKAMRSEAAAGGIYDSPWGTKHPRLQVLTIEALLDGGDIDRPPTKGLSAAKAHKAPVTPSEPLFSGTPVEADTSATPSRATPMAPMVAGDRRPTKRASSSLALPLPNEKRGSGGGEPRGPSTRRR